MSPSLPSCLYVLKLPNQFVANHRLQVRNAVFDLLGQVSDNDLKQLKKLLETQGITKNKADIVANIQAVPPGKIERIDYE